MVPISAKMTMMAYNVGRVRIKRNVVDDTQCEVTALSGSNWSSLNQRIIAYLLGDMDSIARANREVLR